MAAFIQHGQRPVAPGRAVLSGWHELPQSPSGLCETSAMLMKATSFALVGVVNTLIDLAIFVTAYNFLHLPLIPANVLSWFVAVSFSYVMNSTITFAAESGRKLRWRDYAAFVASGLVGVVANTTTLVLASYLVPVWAAKAMAIGVSFLVNFSMSHFVVFRKRTP
jgi:putative flippase GtrA